MKLKFTRRRKMSLTFSAVLASQLFFTGLLNAAVKTLDVEKGDKYNIAVMANPSEQIVVGKVAKLSSRWVGKVIVTTADIEPIEMLKGSQTKKNLKVSFIGGTVGNIRQTLSHQTTLQEGETAILFLSTAAAKTALAGSKVFSHAQGKIPLLNKDENLTRLKTNSRLSSLINNVRKTIR